MTARSAPRALLVHSQPDPASLIQAARRRAAAGLSAGGADVVEVDAHDPVDVAAHRELLADSAMLCLVHPTWWGGQPAAVKRWIDTVLPDDTAAARPLLASLRRIVTVTSHGSGKFMNVLEGEPGLALARRGLRLAAPWRCRTSWIALYDVDASDHDTRAGWLDRVETRCARLVPR